MIRFLFQQSIPKRIAASFAIVILVGSLLLNLPISQLESSQATYFDHLFTTVSMVCVTGLFTQPVAATYNTFGQIICMFLMQIGGLGLMSMIAFFFFDSGKKLSLTGLFHLGLQLVVVYNNSLIVWHIHLFLVSDIFLLISQH